MTHRNFSLQKENDHKFQLCFVKCCTLVVTEGYHILLSPLNRLVRHHFMFKMHIIISGKGIVVSLNGAGGSEPLRTGFKGVESP